MMTDSTAAQSDPTGQEATATAGRRRVLLAASGAAASAVCGRTVIAAAAPAAHADAELVALCEEFERQWKSWRVAFNAPAATIEEEEELERALTPVVERVDAIRDRICGMRAATVDGHRARARALLTQLDPDEMFADALRDETTSSDLALALLRDLAGGDLPAFLTTRPAEPPPLVAPAQAAEYERPVWSEHKTAKARELSWQILALAEMD